METLKMGSDDHSRLSFDANDYRLLRIEELRMSAGVAAENVKRTGVPFRFNPMNSRERRVIHLSLRGETTLRSESGGVGPGRHVVVYPAGMASLPDRLPALRRRAAATVLPGAAAGGIAAVLLAAAGIAIAAAVHRAAPGKLTVESVSALTLSTPSSRFLLHQAEPVWEWCAFPATIRAALPANSFTPAEWRPWQGAQCRRR